MDSKVGWVLTPYESITYFSHYSKSREKVILHTEALLTIFSTLFLLVTRILESSNSVFTQTRLHTCACTRKGASNEIFPLH